VIVAFDDAVTLHIVPVVDVHPVHPLKLLFPAVAGAVKFSIAPAFICTGNGVFPFATTVVFGGPYEICTSLAGFVLATLTV
jgi:hypothetical protein